nr:putative capsid [Marmot picobirnavirus]
MATKKRKGSKPQNGNRHYSKNQRRDVEVENTAKREFSADSRDRRDCYKSADNDPAWYAQNPQLIRDYASFPFGQALGSRMNYGPNIGINSALNSSAIPGVMALYFAPTIGSAKDANAPINVAARNIYSYVRHANSGHSNYEAPDLMMYLLAMDSIYTFHSFMKRIMGLVLDYSTLNRYYPAALIRAMGVDFADISAHIQDFRGYINQYAVKMGSMCVPNSMSYMARHVWMCEGIYTDGTTGKSQTYFYTPMQLLKFQRNSVSQIGELSYVTITTPELLDPADTTAKTYQDLVNLGNSMLDAVLQEEDFNIMSGDILKAFGPEGVVKVSGVAEGYMILPVYNEEVLSQMENATVFNGYLATVISQNTSIDGGFLVTNNDLLHLVIDPRYVATGSTSALVANEVIAPYTANHVLNFHHSDVTPEQVMVATRLTNIISPFTDDVSYEQIERGIQISVDVPTVASEIILAGRIFYYVWDSTGMKLTSASVSRALYNPMTNNPTATDIINTIHSISDRLGRLSTFDWHPAVYAMPFLLGASDAGVGTIYMGSAPLCDYANFTVIDQANLLNMTTAALLSEFSVPQMGAFSTKT